MRITTLCLLALALALPLTATAQSLEITPFLAYRSGGEFVADSSVFDDFIDEFDVDDAEAYGLIVDIPLSRSFAIELLYSTQETDLSFAGGFFGPEEPFGEIELSYLHGGVRWQWAPGQVQPYLALGLGATRLDPSLPELDTENRFSASLAVGIKVMPTDNLGLRFEVRGYGTDLSDYHDDRFCCDRRSDEGDLYQLEAIGGLVLRF